MQLEVPLVIVYKCGTAEGFTVKSAVTHTVGYVHSEYLSCTQTSMGYYSTRSIIRDYAQPRSPFCLLLQKFDH